MRISDWSSDVCSSDLVRRSARDPVPGTRAPGGREGPRQGARHVRRLPAEADSGAGGVAGDRADQLARPGEGDRTLCARHDRYGPDAREGLPVLPHQEQALAKAGEALDRTRYQGARDLAAAFERDPRLARAAAAGA